MLNQRKIDRKTETATGACACCGTRGALTITATSAASSTAGPSPPGGGAPITLCAGCIVALARALADER